MRYSGHWAILGFGYWVVRDTQSGRFLGEVGFADYHREIEPSLHGTPEIGWAPVNFPFPGGTEPMVTGMTDGSMMFHWHYDTFDLPRLPAPANAPPPPAPPPPAGNSLLSSSKAPHGAQRSTYASARTR